jgi:hypothetical protein
MHLLGAAECVVSSCVFVSIIIEALIMYVIALLYCSEGGENWLRGTGA